MQLREEIFEAELAPAEILSLSGRLFVKSLGWILAIIVFLELPNSLAHRLLQDEEEYIRLPIGFAASNLVILGYIILIYVVWHILMSEQRSVSSTLLFSIWKLPVLLFTLFLMGLFTGLLTLLLIIPGVIYFIYWSFTAQIVVLEDLKFGAALADSKAIIRGHWNKVFLYTVPFFLPTILGLVLGQLNFFSSHEYLAVIYDVALFPVFIFETILFTVLYANLSAMPVEDDVLEFEDDEVMGDET